MSVTIGFQIEDVKRQRGCSFAEACAEPGRRPAGSPRRRKNYGVTKKVDTLDFSQIEPPAGPAAAIDRPAESKPGGPPEGPGHALTNQPVERFDAGWPGPTTAPAAFRPGFSGTEIDDEDEPAIEFWDSDNVPDEAGSKTATDGGLADPQA